VRSLATAGAGFLLAVLWFDLMFDVQVGRGSPAGEIPADVLTSISRYYARVTTAARPMNRLVPLAMLVTLGALVAELVRGDLPWWRASASLLLALLAIGLALGRTVRNAVRLGRGEDSGPVASRLARSVLRDHVACFTAIAVVLLLQLAPV
jgi:hypothetical protein